ncbi:MAG: N-acetyl-gamma-glutamyl-phosphate reductase [Pseudomonadales bacterium]
MIKVGIVGGTGYTGVELLRLLATHPEAEVVAITSRSEAGVRVDQMFPSLRGFYDLRFSVPDSKVLAACDVVFFATPHGVAQGMMAELALGDARVIDLSADFRIRDIATWEQWYGQPHGCPEKVAQAVYGLPEVNREQIRNASLVACPGCYPTSIQLGFLPLIKAGIIDPQRLIANSVSGVSGGGKAAKVDFLLTECADSFKAYAVPGHRHLPEIKQGLVDLAGTDVGLTFVPHLVPMIRGMHSTLYATLTDTSVDLQALYEEVFANEPFVDVMPAGEHPQTRTVRGTNLCRIAVHRPADSDQVVVLSVIDNLTKGASGQALQNMNIMFGLDETLGLRAPALIP